MTPNILVNPAGPVPAGFQVYPFMSTLIELEMASFLVEMVRKSGRVLGSHLGSALIGKFPGVRSNPQYPGLKTFIQQHCSGKIFSADNHGGDDMYLAESSDISTATLPSTSVTSATPSPWDVFQHPKASGALWVDRESCETLVLPSTDDPPGDLYSVAKVSPEEHLDIARRFLDEIKPSERQQFETAFSFEPYWPHWSKLVNRPPYKRAWGTFRYERLRALFEARLREHGFSEPVITTALSHLLHGKKSRAERPKSGHKPTQASPPHPKQRFSVTAPLDSTALRAIIHAVIDTMGENELRRLCLPLGDVLDALERSRR